MFSFVYLAHVSQASKKKHWRSLDEFFSWNLMWTAASHHHAVNVALAVGDQAHAKQRLSIRAWQDKPRRPPESDISYMHVYIYINI
jgi:hypothetical protein